MARGENQKLKITYLMKILSEKTDADHGLTMPQIIDELEGYGICAERKGIYNDLEVLEEYGFFVEKRKTGGGCTYHLESRLFQLPELKLLVDSVQSAKFITEKKSRDIIKKLESLCSEQEARQLNRQVYVQGRIKTMNESILYNVDTIHTAISSNCKISFQYWNWNVKKEMELRHDGKRYIVSPWGLAWDSENYYLIAYDDEDEKIKYYRVDKMLRINLCQETRVGEAAYKDMDQASLSRRTFSMFGGEVKTVGLECLNSFAGVIIDRFGKDTLLLKTDKDHFSVNVPVAVSPQFFGWVMSMGDGVRITGPEDVVTNMRSEVERLSKIYKAEI